MGLYLVFRIPVRSNPWSTMLYKNYFVGDPIYFVCTVNIFNLSRRLEGHHILKVNLRKLTTLNMNPKQSNKILFDCI